MNIVMLWLLVGIALIAFEALTTPGLGIFLAGLGAICTSLVIKLGFVGPGMALPQFTWFFAFTVTWTLLLWKHLKNFRAAAQNKNSPSDHREHSDIVGKTAVIVHPGITRGMSGQAAWSGTLMTARLEENSPVDFLPEGTHVTVQSVIGTTLIVHPATRS